MGKIVQLKNDAEWKEYKTNNQNKEKVIFKFSPSCPNSFMAEKKINNWYNNLDSKIEVNFIKIDVINSRELSRTIANEFDIRHQSPQVIWLDKFDKVKWEASHYSITKGALDEQLLGKKVSFLRKIF